VTTYEAGQSLSELPGDGHGISGNAGRDAATKLLAVFVVEHERDGTDDPTRGREFAFVGAEPRPRRCGALASRKLGDHGRV
jgi:hypothetical protein